MVEGANPSPPLGAAAMTCPKCGAPLPSPDADGFARCEYCGVRTDLSEVLAQRPGPLTSDGTADELDPPLASTDHLAPSVSSNIIPAVVAVFVLVFIIIAVVAASQVQLGSSSTGLSAPHCSAAINASSTSGPAPFTATFTAEVTSPPGVNTGEPMWQFGPFGPGFDLNFTYGSHVTHTWDSSGSFGVHLSVPDSTGQGCFVGMLVNVT